MAGARFRGSGPQSHRRFAGAADRQAGEKDRPGDQPRRDGAGIAASELLADGLEFRRANDRRDVDDDLLADRLDARILLREKRLSELQRVTLGRDLDRIEAVLDGITTPASADPPPRSSRI